MYHDLYMGDERSSYPDDSFDTNLTTGKLVAKVSESLIDGENHGDELVIIVRTHRQQRNR